MNEVKETDIYKSLSDESVQVGTAITQKLIWAGRVPLLSLVILSALIKAKIGTATVCCFAYNLHSYKTVAVVYAQY